MNIPNPADGAAVGPDVPDAAARRRGQGSETRARPLILKVRVDAAEREAIRAAAARAGLEVGSYLRTRALTGPSPRAVRRPPVETAALAQMLALLGPLADVARAARRETPDQERLKAACDTLVDLRGLLMQALGRTP